MTKICIVCKKFSIRGDSSRSFHKFPSEYVQRERWMHAIAVPAVPKTATICNDHFIENAYHQTDGYTTLKRLLPDAVPLLMLNEKSHLDVTDNNLKTLMNNNSNVEVECNILKQIDVSNSNSITIHEEPDCESESSQNVNKSIVVRRQNKSGMTGADLYYENSVNTNSTENKHTSVPTATSAENSHVKRKLSEQIVTVEVPNKKPRMQNTNDISGIPTNKIRFMNGFVQTLYICREDFVSDEAWQRFLQYKSCKDSQNSTCRKKNIRAQKKIAHFNELLKNVKEQGERKAAEYLEVF